jgi:hypothetical protein
MTQTPDAQYRYQFAGLRRGSAQRVKSGEPRTKKRCRVNRTQSIRDSNKPIGEGQHHFGVAAIKMSAGDGLICAINKVTATARLALSAMSSQKPYANPLAYFPSGNPLTKCVNFSNDLMTRNTRVGYAGHHGINRP